MRSTRTRIGFLSLLFVAMGCFVTAQSIPPYNVVIGDSLATSGYYFLHAFKLNGTSAFNPSHLILDSLGNTVYVKEFTRTSSDFKVHVNGKMSYSGTSGTPANAKFYIMDSTFEVVDSVQCQNGYFTDTHDMQMLANGHYLMLGYEYVTMNLSAYHWFSGNGSPGDTNARVKCGIIQELDANKSPVFTWRAYEHFDFSDVQEARLLDPHDVDWTHCNAVEVDRDSNFILSSRFFSEVTKIDRQSGNIIWRMNGKRNQFLFSNDPYAGFYGQHDPRRITNGNITLFDNGKAGNPIRPARALEYAVDETSRTANLVWSHTFASNANSGQMGNVQRLGNANTVIGWGGLRNANVALSCVKPNGVTVLHVSFPDTSITYRAFNYPTLPWKLNRPVISCITSGSNHFLDAGAGHGSYLWSTGDTTQTIQILAPGEYQVFVPYGNGGYISSERKLITSMTHPCDLDSAASTTVSFTIATGWNLVSLPVSVVDSSVAVLFPSSASEAFSYSGQYVAGTSMVNRVGYWLKFDTAGQVTVNGVSRSTDTMDVAQGWNLIGSIGTPVATADITSLPGGIVTSSFFSYDVGYSITDSIIPGKGYWVKSSTSGKLVLSSTGSVRASSRIRIVVSSELPPPPPDVDGHAYPTSHIPHLFILDQNFPNPFNPSTLIRYSLPAEAVVTLKVFDIVGREVATLIDGVTQSAGYKSASFEAQGFPSGLYYYKLTAGQYTSVRRMMFVK